MREQVKNLVRSPLAEAILGLRKSKGLTQVDVSKELGVRQSAIVRWERDIDKPSAKAILMLAELAPESERHWWMDQASKRVGFDLEKPELLVQKERKEGKALDAELLAFVMEAVQSAIDKAATALPRKKQAEIIAKTYDRWLETGEHDCFFVQSEVTLACGPSNRKSRNYGKV